MTERTANGPALGNPTFSVHNLVKTDEWNGFRRGDKVIVVGTGDKFAGMEFEFISYVTNTATGVTWVDLWGGMRRHEMQRSVRAEHIMKKVDKRRK